MAFCQKTGIKYLYNTRANSFLCTVGKLLYFYKKCGDNGVFSIDGGRFNLFRSGAFTLRPIYTQLGAHYSEAGPERQ